MFQAKVDLLVLGSNETVTVTGSTKDDLGIIENGGVAIRDGRIVQAASSEFLERKFKPRKKLHVEGQTVLPGFVDPHTHLVFSGSREEEFQLRARGASYMETLKKGRGILETVNRTRQSSLQELATNALTRLNTAIEHGTTTVEIKSGYGLSRADELKILRAVSLLARKHPSRIVPTFLGAHTIPREYTQTDEYLRMIEAMLPEVKARGLARFCDVFCEQGAFNAQESEKILRAASHHGLQAKVHADEFTSSGGTRLANKLRAVSADHLVHAPAEEVERMVESGVTPVLLPASSQSLFMTQHADARRMLSLGLPVALGTDFSPANWVLGQLTVAAVAARLLRMGAGEIIRGVTINAARAIGLDSKVGSLTPGKDADIVTLTAPSHKWVGYSYGENTIDKVIIRGELTVSNGRRLR